MNRAARNLLKFGLLMAGILPYNIAVSQNVAINTSGSAPNAAAALDLGFTSKGLLIPRMTYCQRVTPSCASGMLNGSGLLAAAAQGLFVYQTDGSGEGEGFYYNTSGTTTPAWVKLFGGATGGIYAGSGSLTADPTTVTMGTNNLAFTSTVIDGFSVDGTTFSVNASANRVGIGTASPASTLDVNGRLTLSGTARIIDFASGAGDITSPTGIDLIIDDDNNSTGSIFRVRHDGGTTIFEVQEGGDIKIVPVASAPSGNEGEIYTDSGDDIPYYHDGTAWRPFMLSSNLGNYGWLLSGNAGTTAGTDYVGTTDAVDLVFSTAGTERVRINGVVDGFDGFMGIGTNNPLQSLHVADDLILGGGQDGNNDGTTEFLKIWAQSKVWNIGAINDAATANSDFFVSQTDGVADGTFHIEPTGHVGIGTAAPASFAKLHVEIDDIDDALYVKNSNATSNTNAVFRIDVTSAASNGFRVQRDGKVGIGTASPGRLLEVSGDGATYSRITSATSVSDVGLELLRVGAGSYDWRIVNISGNLRFQGSTNDLSTVGDVMTLEYSSGDVGIGTTNPDDKLDVVGNGHISGYLKVGAPTAPSSSINSSSLTLYNYSLDNGTVGWTTIDECGGYSKWYVSTTGSLSGAIYYDNDADRNISYLYSPLIWVPTGASSIMAEGTFYCDLENNFDGAWIEYKYDGGSWTKITTAQFEYGSYPDNADGCESTCTTTNSQPCWNGISDTWFFRIPSTSFSASVYSNWVQFRFVGFEDGADATGNYILYGFGLSCIASATAGGAFASGNVYAEKNVYAGSSVLMGDLAEYFPVAGYSEPGDLIAMLPDADNEYSVSHKKYSSNIIGIHSSNPTLTLNDPNSGVPIGLQGRVPVKVTGSNGPIQKGDYLTASDVPGHAMKATGACFVVGRALDNFEKEGKGKVVCLIETGWYNPASSNLLNSGTFKVTKGTNKVKVMDRSIKEESRIFITMLADPGNRYWVSEQETGSFVLRLSGETIIDVPFNYFVENANEPLEDKDEVSNDTMSESFELADKDLGPNYNPLNENRTALPHYTGERPPSNVPDPTRGYYWAPEEGFVPTTESLEFAPTIQKEERQPKPEFDPNASGTDEK